MEEGRGGFMDSGKYRQVLTDLFWYGKVPEETAEQHKERLQREATETKESIGKRETPTTALDDLRSMQAAIKARASTNE